MPRNELWALALTTWQVERETGCVIDKLHAVQTFLEQMQSDLDGVRALRDRLAAALWDLRRMRREAAQHYGGESDTPG